MASKLSSTEIAIHALLPSLIPIVTDRIYFVWGVDDVVKQLQKTLEAIQGAITDAENQHANREITKLWLRDLEEIAYDVHDILDENAYESVRNDISTRRWKKLRDFFSSSNFIILGYKMGKKIKNLKKKLVQIGVSKNMFHHSENIMSILSISNSIVSNIGQTGRETISYVDPSEIVGRELEELQLVKLLINSSNNQEASSSSSTPSSSIIRIVGMGGVGKTALAQIVYNNKDVVGRFQEKAWVSIPQHSNQKQIFNQLLESLFDQKCDESSGLDVIAKKLTIGLRRKRYLIVLDNMWNHKGNQWEDMLKTLLHIGAQGSKVIITSRNNEGLASVTSYLCNYNLVGLSGVDCWLLLKKIAFGLEGVHNHANLIEIGKRIAKNCGGVPLAIRVLGSLMYKQRTEEDWRSIENNVIWNLPEGKEQIINVLKLSYDHLEPNLKQCFKYCSLFPKDHLIKKKTLVQLWMAEGFLSSAEPNTEMDVAERYFVSLLRNSFFQDAKENDMGNVKSCKMHILVHDLAQFLSKTEISIMYVNKIPKQKFISVRRISLFTDQDMLSPLPELLSDERKRLRAFFYTSPKFVDNAYAIGQIFKNFSHLRVLDLSYCRIKELTPSIAGLKYLRYLNLSNSRLTKLPNSITTLYNLQILILRDCFELKVLPPDMSNLKDLRHLIICKSKSRESEWISPTPRKVGELIKLQYLPVFTVGDKSRGFGIEELRALNLLGGKLHIHNLENVTVEDAEGARIGEKQHIHGLELHWTLPQWRLTERYLINDILVLEQLQPHRNLKKLGICNYVGSNFSSWMMNLNYLLPNLVSITLKNCSNCEHLPPLGLLPFLKILNLYGFPALKVIGREFFHGNTTGNVSSFPCLEDLSVFRMNNLEEWFDLDSVSSSSLSFPVLNKLKVKFCPKLRIMPIRISSLKELKIKNCVGEAGKISSLVENNLKSLITVSIKKCEELAFLSPRLLMGNYILQSLLVKECPKFEGFNVDEELIMEEQKVEEALILKEFGKTAVHTLSLQSCPALISLPDISRFKYLIVLRLSGLSMNSLPIGIECLPGLQHLSLGGFSEELISFPFPAANEGRILSDYFPSLVSLDIHGWDLLDCLPDQIQYITSLENLSISTFDSLEVLPDWLADMASLRQLSLERCANLKYMPSEEQMQRLTSLQELTITHCPLLADRCKGGGGEEHYKMSTIPSVEVIESDQVYLPF